MLSCIEGKSALHTVVRKGFKDCSKLLIDSGADVNCTDEGI